MIQSNPDGGAGQIRVAGTASRWAAADHADVGFTITRKARTSADAVADASRAYEALAAALDRHGDVIVRRTTTSLSVRAKVRFEPDTGRQVHEGFVASRSQAARFSPVAGAAAALRDVVSSVPDLAVSSPDFGLDPDNAVHAEVRSAAAADARATAEAYAAGVGLTLGRIRRLLEPGLEGPSPRGEMLGGPMLARSAKAVGDEDESLLVELTDEDVEVTATIVLEADFGDG